MREKHWAIAVRQRRTQLTVQVWASYEDPVDQTHDWKKVYRHRFAQETMGEFFLRVAEDCGWRSEPWDNDNDEGMEDEPHKWNAMEEEINNNDE